jgi:hypothetical protein
MAMRHRDYTKVMFIMPFMAMAISVRWLSRRDLLVSSGHHQSAQLLCLHEH